MPAKFVKLPWAILIPIILFTSDCSWSELLNFMNLQLGVKIVYCSHKFTSFAKFSKRHEIGIVNFHSTYSNLKQYFACLIAFTFKLRACECDESDVVNEEMMKSLWNKSDVHILWFCISINMMDVKLMADENCGVQHRRRVYKSHPCVLVCGTIIKLFKRFGKLITR